MPTKQEMHDFWLSSQAESIADLFFFEKNLMSIKAQTYELNETQLTTLFSALENDDHIQFRVYLAANAEEVTAVPSFTPIVQAFKANTVPPNIDANSFIANFNDQESPFIRVNSWQASQMKGAWWFMDKGSLFSLFFSYMESLSENLVVENTLEQLSFTTFDHQDSDQIREHFKLFDGFTRKLNIHLAYEMPVETAIPFGFRFIMESYADITQNPGNNPIPDAPTSLSFEFSYPCPPLCGGLTNGTL